MTGTFDDRPERFLTESETAKLLRLGPRTLQRYRRAGTGPRFVLMGRRVRYRTGDVAAWTLANTHQVKLSPVSSAQGERS